MMRAKYEGAAFTERFGPWAAIAGGSDGIGRAFAEVLAERGLDLVLIARDPKKLEATARAIREAHGVEVRLGGHFRRLDVRSRSPVGERRGGDRGSRGSQARAVAEKSRQSPQR